MKTFNILAAFTLLLLVGCTSSPFIPVQKNQTINYGFERSPMFIGTPGMVSPSSMFRATQDYSNESATAVEDVEGKASVTIPSKSKPTPADLLDETSNGN